MADEFTSAFREAAAEEDRDAAFAAVAKVAKAAGVFDETAHSAGSIEQAGDMIAAEVERLRAVHLALTHAGQAEVDTGDGRVNFDDAMLRLALGTPPWTVTYRLTDSIGRTIVEGKVGPLTDMTDKAHIQFGLSDVRVSGL